MTVTRKRKRKIKSLSTEADPLISDETSFHPNIPSDFTIHFQNHAIHVHSIIVQNASKYFEAAIQSANVDQHSCELTPSCVLSNGRCLTIGDGEDKIGGMTATVEQLQRLISQMYDTNWFCKSLAAPHSQITEWRDGLTTGGRVLYDRAGGEDAHPDHNPEWFIADIKSCDAEQLVLSYLIVDDADDTAQADHGGLTEEEIHLSRESDQLQPLGISEVKVNEDDLERFLDQHSHTVMLANYFCCLPMMQLYKCRAHQLAVNAVDLEHYEPLWELLVISEACHWNDITDLILESLSKDDECTKRDNWSAIAEKISSKSLVKLFGAMLE